jgi:hypothetical protein
MENSFRKLIREKMELDIEVGDELLGGRFKNKKVIVKTIGKDDKNQPTINNKPLLKFRIKKIIKKEIDKLFETLDIQYPATEQMAINSAMFKLPRKGVDDSINNYNQVQSILDTQRTEEEKEEDFKNKFLEPVLGSSMATVSTNIYESLKDIDESYGIYGSTQAAQQNLDWDRGVSPATANYGKETQDDVDLFNGNIERDLNAIPPGDSRENSAVNNTFENNDKLATKKRKKSFKL